MFDQSEYNEFTKELTLTFIPLGIKIRFGSWSKGMVFSRFSSESQHWCEISQVNFPILERRDKAVEKYLQNIPESIVSLTQPFKIYQVEMIKLSLNVEYLKILEDMPTLAWLVAIQLHFEQDIVLSQITQKKRKDILNWALGFSSCKGGLKIAAKFDAKSYGQWELELIKTLLSNKTLAKPFLHLKLVESNLVADFIAFPNLQKILLADYKINPTWAESRLITLFEQKNTKTYLRKKSKAEAKEKAWSRDCEQKSRRLQDLALLPLRVRDCLRNSDYELPSFMRRHRAENYNPELPAFMRRHQPENYENEMISFPPPPHEGASDGKSKITPILTPEDLHTEGAEMDHCVYSRRGRIASGRIYCYRVEGVERATLQVSCGVALQLEELKGERNKNVTNGTRHFVASWLREANLDYMEKRNNDLL
ncbi:MAG: hypothetical protein QNL04_11000 [SAR324 cluster bacterium]|nr:hypothetical protein [SAR324 cluster bacterium]